MDESDDPDSEVEISRKRKLNIFDDEDSDETDGGDDEESESDGEDESDDSEDDPDDDIKLTDDTNKDQCAICLMEFTDQKVGIPNNCTHVFCLVCIQEWAKNINTCPVDRKVFYTISVKKAKNGVTVEEIKVEDRTQVKEEQYEDPTTCEICRIGDREDRMLLCDGCDRGFHLECLTPPLDSVPDEEWFCRDCFVDHTQDNTQKYDAIDYSQHAIAFSDDELPPFEQQTRPTADRCPSHRISMSGASTSQQRRARTVATSRGRRRRRTTQGRRRPEGQRSRKKKKKKTKTSDKGTTATTIRTSKEKRRKRKKRKKTTKKKMKDNESSHQTTRYLLPCEMEPTATFSLFGSDFDLEYLPVIEAPAVISKQPSPPRSSTPADPDVLGSIFTGLNTLHSASLSVDNKGRVKSEESKQANQSITKSEIPKSSTQTTSSSLSGSTLSTCCPREISVNSSIHRNVHKQSNSRKMEKCNETESASRKLINEKRLVRFDISTSAPTFTKPKTDCSSLADHKNISQKRDPEKMAKLKCKEDKLSTSCASTSSSRSRSETELRASQPSLASYRIPRKPSTSASNLAPAMPKSKTLCAKSAAKSKSPIKSLVNSSESRTARSESKVPNVPKESSGILHLLPAEVGGSSVRQTRIAGGENTCNEGIENDPKQSPITGLIVSNTRSVSKTKDERSFESASKISNSRSNRTANVPYANEGNTPRYPAPENTSVRRQLLSNVKITSTRKDHSSFDVPSSSGQTFQYVEPSRPVAVVRPTKIDENNCRETSSHDTEAAKRRKEGIERLQRRQIICEEVKNALKPFYKHREISKENYKHIYSRAAEKISKSTLPVVSRDVANLVRNYVKKLKGRQSQQTLCKD